MGGADLMLSFATIPLNHFMCITGKRSLILAHNFPFALKYKETNNYHNMKFSISSMSLLFLATASAVVVDQTPCASNEVELVVNVVTDIYPQDTYYTLTSSEACKGTSISISDGDLVGCPYGNCTNIYCVTPAEYTFAIYDVWQDGE